MRISMYGAARTTMGDRLAGFIYGTIVVLSVIVGGARDYGHEPGHIAVVAAITCFVFWLGHVYAHAVCDAVSHEERLTWTALRTIAHREASIIEAAVPSTVALLLGTLHFIDESTALWLAFALGLGVLGAQGVVYARVERLGALGTAAIIGANIALGLVLVGLKLFVSH